MGYVLAGFDVVGVDIAPQSNYPSCCRFMQADVLDLPLEWVRRFDAIHASPPCQFATSLRFAPGGRAHPNLIPQTRDLLEASGLPWIIENVEPARPHLRDPIMLCGTMFGLGVEGHELRRHRLFESNIDLQPPSACRHGAGPVVGVYGGHARRRSAAHGGRGTQDVWQGGHRQAMSRSMGMDWATCAEMSEAIPPAYTQWLGQQLMAAVVARDDPRTDAEKGGAARWIG